MSQQFDDTSSQQIQQGWRESPPQIPTSKLSQTQPQVAHQYTLPQQQPTPLPAPQFTQTQLVWNPSVLDSSAKYAWNLGL